VIFIPTGGVEVLEWSCRLATLTCPEFFLYDREGPVTSSLRLHVVEFINQRIGCHTAITGKRSLESYLHPGAIFEAKRVHVEFDGNESVADKAARAIYKRGQHAVSWQQLPARARRRYRNRAKHWLNRDAVQRMTPARLAESDPRGEIRSWLTAIGSLLRGLF
jgi:hypothetical protein